jgi:3-hydroxyisobutyrate dehydrogenase
MKVAFIGLVIMGMPMAANIAKKYPLIGYDLSDVVTALSYGGAQCFYLDTKAKNILAKTYPTAFSVGNMAKDVHFAQELAEHYQKECPGLMNVVSVYEKAMASGLEKSDFSSAYSVVNQE